MSRSKTKTNTSDVLLFTTAGIWGFAFVAQRVGMEHLGPFAFNGIRFLLGAATLLPLLWLSPKWSKPHKPPKRKRARKRLGGKMIWLGILLFMGASLQQMGIVHTTAGNAGFITGLYVVFVPIFGYFLGKRTGKGTLIGIMLATIGMYLLSMTDTFSIAWGDFLVLLGAVFWALHVLLISWLSKRVNLLRMAVTQYLICSILSVVTAIIIEEPTLEGISAAALPILYGGICSAGIAYTLQVIGQKKAHPAHAAILLSLEAVFAAFGGWLVLGEVLSTRAMVGAGLMLAGMLVSQLWGLRRIKRNHNRAASPTVRLVG